MINKDNVVYLLVGQRGSGKSHYAEQILKNQPEMSVVSRDEIMMRLFGSVYGNPYTGQHHITSAIMCRLLRRKLSTQTGLKVILDTWTGTSEERTAIAKKLKQYGATRIVALYFTTPLVMVDRWFWEKPGIAKMEDMGTRQGERLVFFSNDAPARDYETFHECAAHIDSDGFDAVIRINPTEPCITLV